MSKQFIVVTAAGTPVVSSADPEEALYAAKSLGPTQWLAPSSIDEPTLSHNPPGMSRPELALLKSGLRPISREEVERFMSKDGLKRAHAALLPVFEEANRATKRVASISRGKPEDEIGGVGLSLQQWLSPGSGFLSANAKLMKRDDGREGVALGLNLVPEFTLNNMRTSAGASLPMRPPSVAGRAAINFCTGSSAECRTSCLSGTGQNASDIRNLAVKMAKAKALIEHPAEFMAILYAAGLNYAQAAGTTYPQSATKFLRLNVLSDLPWEMIAPWMLDDLTRAGVSLYDYTKVPGRYHPHYDLTFSFSGSNRRDMDAEHAAGRRIAIVFLAPEYIKGQVAARVAKAMAPSAIRGMLDATDKLMKGEASMKTAKVGLAAWRALNPLPRTFRMASGEVPVVDGDYTDFRPWDPPGVVVGLRWKTPSIADQKTGKKRELRLEETPKTFVVMGEVHETKDGLVYALPHTPNNDENTVDQARAAHTTLEQLYDTDRAKKLRRGRLPMASVVAAKKWDEKMGGGK